MSYAAHHGRVDWVDVAKGMCIIFVVMMHSTLGVEAALGGEGFMHYVVEFARPFRMPDFFMIAGLFLAARIDRPWRGYLDAKVFHFAYFYVLWVTIQFAFKAPVFAGEYGVLGMLQLYAMAFIQPFGTLWFIYLLPIFFVVSKLARPVHWSIVPAVGAFLEMAHVNTGSVIIDEFCARFVYFYAGYALAPHIFRLAANAARSPAPTGALIGIWGLVNGILVHQGLSTLPVISLLLGFAGAGAIVITAVFLSMTPVSVALRYLGAHSIVVYLAFFLPMAVVRTAMIKLGYSEPGSLALLVTAAGVTGPVILFEVTRRLGILSFLFNRPDWARLKVGSAGPRVSMVPAE